MALTPDFDHSLLAGLWSASRIEDWFKLGNITQEDAQLAISLQDFVGEAPFEAGINAISSFANNTQNQVVTGISDILGNALNLPFDLESKIRDWIQKAIDPALTVLTSIPSKVKSDLQELASGLLSTTTQLSQSVLGSVGSISTGITDTIASLDSKIIDPVLGLLKETGELISGIDDKVKENITRAVTPIIETTQAVFEQVEGFATAIRDTIPDLAETLGVALAGAGDFIGDAVKGAFQDFIDSTGLNGLKAVMDAVNRIPELLDPQGAFSPPIVEKMGAGALKEFLKNPPAMTINMIPFVNNVAGIVFGGIYDRVRQASTGDANSGLMPVSDMTSLYQRGLATIDEVGEMGFRSGLNETQVRHVFELTKTRLGTMDIIDYWRREIISDAGAYDQLRSLGWDDDHISLIQSAAFPPPGVQDLLRMAVREVFSPEIASKFGQFDEIPQPYLEWSKKIGLSDEWARNYWAAHWELPSVQQGFEMLHRGVINESDIESLFVALDIMPFWRPALKAISHSPYTRVDVRRMYGFGILTREQVKRAYLDLGFDDTKAENMTEFTVRYVDSQTKVDKEKERDLTKGDIIGLFNDGLLTSELAKAHLVDMGYDTVESELLIDREEIQDMIKERKADISAIVEQAKIKVLTFQEAQDRLNGLDLSRREMEKALIQVTRATTERVRLPSKSDLDGWQAIGLLTASEYEKELDNLGYPSRYVALYMEQNRSESTEDLLAAEEREAKKVSPRSISKGQLDSLLRSEIITVTGYRSGLVSLGYTALDVDNFVTQITIQIEESRIEAEARSSSGQATIAKEKPINRTTLGSLLLKGVIDSNAYQDGLATLGFSNASIKLLVELIEKKMLAASSK